MKKILLSAMVLITGLSAQVLAGDIGSSAGLILKRTDSVRAAGMGSAQAAVATDEAGAMGSNPATLEGNGPSLSAVYYRGIVDDAFGALSGSLNVNENLVCGAGVMMYEAGKFDLTSDWGESTSVLAQRDILATVTSAYSSQLMGTTMTAGANLKFLQTTLLEKYSAFAAATDLGLSVRLPWVWKDLQAGLAIKNLGTPIKYIEAADPLPSFAVLGLACEFLKQTDVSFLLAGDLQYDLNNRWHGQAGVEVRLLQCLGLRMGYRTDTEATAFTLGMGFQLENLEINYAFSPSLVFNSTHVAGVTYAFAPLVKAKAKSDETNQPETEADYLPENIKPKASEPTEKIRAAIMEIRKAGGRPSKVVMSSGTNQQIQVGFKGVIADAEEHPLAAIVIRQVEPDVSLADIISLSQDIGVQVIAIIEKPVVEQKGE